MKLPTQIRIGHILYTVVLCDRIEDEGKELLGEIDTELQLIELKRGQRDILGTLIHEIMHGISYYSGIPLEENEVEGLSNFLMLLFKDNPDLAEALKV